MRGLKVIIIEDFGQIYLINLIKQKINKQTTTHQQFYQTYLFYYLMRNYSQIIPRTRDLIDDLNKTCGSYKNTNNPQKILISTSQKQKLFNAKVSKEKYLAKIKYQNLTNKTKEQQRQLIWQQMQKSKAKKKQWTHSFYTGNNKIPHAEKTFSAFQRTDLQEFPSNNKKYNIQFLEKSLHGRALNFPRSESGQFKKPQDHLYSRHYLPIIKQNVKFNQDWVLRTSLFGKTQVDHKRDRVMDKYHIQSNPFKTPRSNSLISQIIKSQVC